MGISPEGSGTILGQGPHALELTKILVCAGLSWSSLELCSSWYFFTIFQRPNSDSFFW